MRCFLFPKFFSDDLNRLIASYWWNGDEREKRIHWCSWEKLCTAKSEGDLGFRNLYGFNLALLAKQGWRLLSKPNSLVANILKAKYHPNFSFMEAHASTHASYCWKSICATCAVIASGLRWHVQPSGYGRIRGPSSINLL